MTAKTKTTDNERIEGYLLSHYRGREDVVLVYGDGTEPRPRQLSRPMKANDIAAKHLTNQEGYGVYPVLEDGNCWFAALDLDNKPERPDPQIRAKVRAIHAALNAIELDHLVCTSQSGRGYHVTLYFAAATPAWLPRRVLAAVLAKCGLSGIEIFPKQDSLRMGQIGNAIRLPLFGESRFVDPSRNLTEKDALDALRSVRRLDRNDLDRAAGNLGVDLVTPPAVRPGDSVSIRPSGTAELSTAVGRLLAVPTSMLSRRWAGDTAGLTDTSRSGAAMSIACCLVSAGIEPQEAADTLAIWCKAQSFNKSDEWIAHTVTKAEEFVASPKQLGKRQVQAAIAKAPPAIAAQLRRKYRRK